MNTQSLVTSAGADSPLARAADELMERLAASDQVDVESLLTDYPEHEAELRRLLPAMMTLKCFGNAATAPATSAAPAGVALGDFRLLRELGRGGMGVVYEAEQLSLTRRVAVKVLPFAGVLDERHLLRFKHEATAAAMLKHPHIVSVYSIGCERGVHYYAMELIDGQTLAELIGRRRSQESGAGSQELGVRSQEPGARSGERNSETLRALRDSTVRRADFFAAVAQLGIQAAEALEHAHQHGVVHRDVKPSNLMVDARGHLWITDFGLAMATGDASLTMTGDLVGTLRYMSPEQAESRYSILDHRTDIYSLGATLYELATDRPVIQGQERAEILREIAEKDPASPRKLAPNMPVDLETIVLKCLNKEPSARYASALALAEDLRRFLDEKPVVARRQRRINQIWHWVRRHRAVSVSITLAMVAVQTLLIGTAVNNHRLNTKNDELRSLLYLKDISIVDAARREQKIDLASELLNRHRPPAGASDMRDFTWHWLHRALNDEELVLRGHTDQVSAVAYASNGKLLVSGSHDGTVRVWDAMNGQPLSVLTKHQGNVNCLQFLPNDEEFISAGDDGLLCWWRVRDGQLLHVFTGHQGNALCIAISRDGRWLASGGEDKTLRIWDLSARKLVHHNFDSEDWIRAIAFSDDDSLLAVGGHDRRLRVYHTSDGALAWQSRDVGQILSIDIAGANNQLLLGNAVGEVTVWDAYSGERLWRAVSGAAKMRAVQMTRDGRQFVSVDWQGRSCFGELTNGTRERTRSTHSSHVWGAALAPDGDRLATAGEDGTVRIWNLRRPIGGDVIATEFSDSARLAMSAGGAIVACLFDNHIELWHTVELTRIGIFPVDRDQVETIAISESGEHLATGNAAGRVALIDVKSLQESHAWNADERIGRLAFQPGGTRVAAISQGQIHFFDIADHEYHLRIPSGTISALDVAPDGSEFATGQFDDERLTVWSMATGEPRLSVNNAATRQIVYSPDGRSIASQLHDGSIVLWDAQSGQLQSRLLGASAAKRPFQMSFSPHGDLLAIANGSAGLTLISLASKQVAVRMDEQMDIRAALFTPDGRSIWAIRDDGNRSSLIRWSSDRLNHAQSTRIASIQQQRPVSVPSPNKPTHRPEPPFSALDPRAEQVAVPILPRGSSDNTGNHQMFAAKNSRRPLRLESLEDRRLLNADRFEPNDSLETATALDSASAIHEPGLSIHSSTDFDFFRWTAPGHGTLQVSLAFVDANGDIDLELYDADGNLLRFSNSTTDHEEVAWSVQPGAPYYVKAYGWRGALNPDYSLQVTFDMIADRFEPNDTVSAATNLGAGDHQLVGLSVHSAENSDYFRWHADVSGKMFAEARFTNSLGDLDLRLLNVNGGIISSSESSDDNEELSWDVVGGTDYIVEVYGHGDAVNPNYSLTIDGQESPVVKLDWAARGGAEAQDMGNAVAVDRDGNVYTTGEFRGAFDVDPGDGVTNLQSAGDADAYLIKYDPAGALVWARVLGGSDQDVGIGVATDDDGNVYATGWYRGSVDFDPGSGVARLDSQGGHDAYVLKLDADGNYIWARSLGGSSNDIGRDVVVDALGNVFIAGMFQGTADFDPGAGSFPLSSAGGYDAFVVKLEPTGHLAWAQRLGGAGEFDTPDDLDVDASGNAYVVGSYRESATAGPFTVSSVGADDILVAKIASGGAFEWVKSFGGTSVDAGQGIAVDAAGNSYLTGFFQLAVDFDPGAGEFPLVSAGSNDVFVMKLDPQGTYAWARRQGGPDADAAYAIALDGSGGVYVTGGFGHTADFDPSPNRYVALTSAGGDDVFLSKTDSNGEYQWAIRTGGEAGEFAKDLDVDAAGNVLVAGYFQGAMDFAPLPDAVRLTSAGSNDFFIFRVAPIPANSVPGDTNADGRVDLEDLNNVRNNFGGTEGGDTAPFDGDVDLDDLNAVRNNFGATRGAPASTRLTQASRRYAVAVDEALVLPAERYDRGARSDLQFAWESGLLDFATFTSISSRSKGRSRGLLDRVTDDFVR